MYDEKLKRRIRKDLEKKLSKHRFVHTLGVAQAAMHLAEKYGGDSEKAELAGLLHDAAKELSLKDMQTLSCRSFNHELAPEIMGTGSLLHGYAAATIARETYGIEDTDIILAIAHHTTGALHMGLLEKIVFLADYIEVNRDFDGVERLRKAADEDLDKAVLYGYDSTISNLLHKEKTIFTGTVQCRNSQIDYMKSLQRKL